LANQYPTLPRNATTPHFRRLLWRCGFSGSEKQIAHYRSLGLNGAIENLLAPRSPAKLSGPAPKVNGNPIAPANAWGHDTLWWLDRMVRSHNQLEERMTLSLHDHFATSNSGVGNTRHMLRQNKLLRSHAVGNFLDLVTRLTHDPAMLLWLNGADSNKWAPNENYARELMELFCLGNDPALEAATYGLWKQSKVYTQADIHAAALALTGWRYDWNKASNGSAAQQENPTFYDSSWHATGSKTIFGHTGTWDWQDVVRLVIRNPNHAPFLAWKLWSYFIPTPPTKSAMQMMVGNYLSSGYNLKPLLRVILRHPAMYQALDAPDLVKPPVVFVASTLRMTNQFITDDAWAWLLEAMGQVPFYPPNVSGWDQGPAWLNTNSAHAYWQTTDYLIRDTVGDPGQESASAAVTRAISALSHPWVSNGVRTKLEGYAQSFFNAHNSVVGGKHVLDSHERVERQRVLRALILAGPDGFLS
jgi:uncharacterized protein (DUF1800 family)